MSLQYYFSTFLLVLCTIHVLKCDIVLSEEEFDTSTPSMKNVPRSVWTLVDKIKEAVERINGVVDSDVSFHPLDSIDGEYLFDLSEVLSDPYVTGIDLSWASSSEQTCKMVLAGNTVELQGKVIYGYVFFDLDTLLAEGRSNEYIKAKVLSSHMCRMKTPYEKTFLVVYRNETKTNLFRELENLRSFRSKRHAEKISSDNQSIGKEKNPDNQLRENETSLDKTSETNPRKTGCRLVPWTVDFVQLHWDRFILFPKSFEASACQGDCVQTGKNCTNSLSDMKPTNYSLLRILYRLGLKTLTEKPSCKPAKYGSQAVMFLRDGDFIIKSVAKMRVVECKCDC